MRPDPDPPAAALLRRDLARAGAGLLAAVVAPAAARGGTSATGRGPHPARKRHRLRQWSFNIMDRLTIPDSGSADKYPSVLTVALPSPVAVKKVVVRFFDFAHTHPNDLTVTLWGPGGQDLVPMSRVGGSTAATDLSFTLSDAGTPLTNATVLQEGRAYRPAGGPSNLGKSPLATTFTGAPAAGDWFLYVHDDLPGDSGTLGGWGITFWA